RIGEGGDEQGRSTDLARREILGEIAPDGAGGAGHFRRRRKGKVDDLSRSRRRSQRVERLTACAFARQRAPRFAEGGGRSDNAEPRQRDDQPQETEAEPPARTHRPLARQSLMRPYWMASYTASPRVSTCSLR